LLLLVCNVALAAPHIKTPTLREIMAMSAPDMLAKARVRWSQIDRSQRIVVEIHGGEATRVNPGWSPEPQRLHYDLARNRHLDNLLKQAKLPPPMRREPRDGDRVLEILAEGDEGWVVIAEWSMPLKQWQKGKLAAICDELEPLFKVQADVFDNMKTP
jgi:hypothetical protein